MDAKIRVLTAKKEVLAMQIVIGAIGVLSIAILGYLSWVLMKEE